MIVSADQREYSSTIDIRLKVGDTLLDVTQVSESFLVLKDPASVPPKTEAEVIIIVDGRARSRKIFLHQGIDPSELRVTFL
jgi:hypothetical protein